MLKWIGVLMVLAGSSGLGLYYSARLRSRERTLLLGQQYFQLLRGTISYGVQPLPEALLEVAQRSHSPWKEFFQTLTEGLEEHQGSFGEVWERAAVSRLSASLSEKDRESLCRTGKNLGYLDKAMQLNYLDMLLEEMGSSYREMQKQGPEKRKLYTAWGILGGVFLIIFLI